MPRWGVFYIGKMQRDFCEHMKEHVYAANIRDLDSPIGKHIASSHGYKLPPFKFTSLNKIHKDPKGGD